MILLLLGCGVSDHDLQSENWRIQERAIEELPIWQARRLVPYLDEAMLHERVRVVSAAADALIRANSDEGEQALRKHLNGNRERGFVLRALGNHQSKRSCDLLAELYVASLPGERTEEQEELEAELRSTSLEEGWPCFQSLGPYRDRDPRVERLWTEASKTLTL